MNILTDSEIFTAKGIAKIEDKKNAKYVCETCLRGKNGWINSPVAVFWNKDPSNIPAGGSPWFGMFFRVVDPADPNSGSHLYITNAISAVQHIIVGVRAMNDDIIYSRYRHDYRVSPDGTAMVDGGRDYIRTGPFGKGMVDLQIVEGDLVIAPARKASDCVSAVGKYEDQDNGN